MDNRLGVYIHIPFCASRCSYCDFCSYAGAERLMPYYHEALLEHIAESESRFAPYYVDTVYFGGGTPTYYGSKRVCEILAELKYTASVLKESEITVEANPDSMDLKGLIALRREGVNRLSIGVQAASDDILRLMGRRHSFRQAQDAVKMARDAGFDNVSIDLMFGLPGQTRKEWAETLSRALELRPEHISCYELILEDGTSMHTQFQGTPLIPDEDELADMYLYAVDTFANYGYPQYEISNFAVPGYESRHNMKYWILDDYIGFGPSAHSKIGNRRYAYTNDLEAYINGVLDGEELVTEQEELPLSERASEYIIFGLRTSRGISADEFLNVYSGNFGVLEALLHDFEKKGWARYTAGRWAFTASGFLLSNTLINALLDARKRSSSSDTFDDDDPPMPQYKLNLRDSG